MEGGFENASGRKRVVFLDIFELHYRIHNLQIAKNAKARHDRGSIS